MPLTVLLADNVVNAPVLGVPLPTGPGAAKVALPRVAAFTLVRDAPLMAGRLPRSFVASIEVAAEIVPGAINVLGIDRVGVVVPVTVI